MIYIVLLAVVISRGLRARTKPRARTAFSMKTAVRASSFIAVVRLGLFWSGMALLGYPDWRQVVGYELLVLTSLVELGFAGSLVLGSALVVLTSAVLGWAWAWARFRSSVPRGA
jgi:hypothetical protein